MPMRLHTLSQNVTSLSRHNSDIHESILIIFSTDVTKKVGNQEVACFIFVPHLTSASALPGEMKDKNSILVLKCGADAFPDFNQTLT